MNIDNKVQQDFREIVTQDILGNLHQSLRSDMYLELWYQDLMDIKVNTEIRLANLDDSEFQQGSMNRHRAMEQDRDATRRTKKFLWSVKARISECDKLLKGLRIRQTRTYQSVMAGPFSTELKDLTQQLQNYRALLDRNNHYLFNNALTIQDQLEGFKRHKQKCKNQKQNIADSEQHFRSLLMRLICQFEDCESLDELVEEARLAVGWDVPFGEIPLVYRKRKKEIEEIAS